MSYQELTHRISKNLKHMHKESPDLMQSFHALSQNALKEGIRSQNQRIYCTGDWGGEPLWWLYRFSYQSAGETGYQFWRINGSVGRRCSDGWWTFIDVCSKCCRGISRIYGITTTNWIRMLDWAKSKTGWKFPSGFLWRSHWSNQKKPAGLVE